MESFEGFEGIQGCINGERIPQEHLTDAQQDYLCELIPPDNEWLCMDFEQKADVVYNIEQRIDEMGLTAETIPQEYFEYKANIKQLEQFQNIECIENCVLITDYAYSSGVAERYMEGDTGTREAIAHNYFNDIKGCMELGLNVPLIFRDMPEGNMGGYNPDNNSIELNSTYLEHPDPHSLFKTIVHESEHAFQQKCISNPLGCNVSPEVIAMWKYNMEHYKPASVYGLEEYRNQPIEKDAFNVEKYVFAQVDKLKNLRD